eukprot:923193-Pyramimonas_sp.AAC.1
MVLISDVGDASFQSERSLISGWTHVSKMGRDIFPVRGFDIGTLEMHVGCFHARILGTNSILQQACRVRGKSTTVSVGTGLACPQVLRSIPGPPPHS